MCEKKGEVVGGGIHQKGEVIGIWGSFVADNFEEHLCQLDIDSVLFT